MQEGCKKNSFNTKSLPLRLTVKFPKCTAVYLWKQKCNSHDKLINKLKYNQAINTLKRLKYKHDIMQFSKLYSVTNKTIFHYFVTGCEYKEL